MSETNPYKSPEAAEDAAKDAAGEASRAYLWSLCVLSVATSLLAVLMIYLHGYWHWHPGPWSQTLPGQLGLSWLVAVDGSKAANALLAIVSLFITRTIYRKKGYIQALIALPVCVLALLGILVQS